MIVCTPTFARTGKIGDREAEELTANDEFFSRRDRDSHLDERRLLFATRPATSTFIYQVLALVSTARQGELPVRPTDPTRKDQSAPGEETGRRLVGRSGAVSLIFLAIGARRGRQQESPLPHHARDKAR
jgi:hypothetical protein